MGKEVEEYLENQKSPQKEICKKLRKIILKTFPDIREETKLFEGSGKTMKYIVISSLQEIDESKLVKLLKLVKKK